MCKTDQLDNDIRRKHILSNNMIGKPSHLMLHKGYHCSHGQVGRVMPEQ